MTDPKVAVIMPYRDAIKSLYRSVKSILNQTFQELEFILINDGSTDGSREFVETVGDSRIRTIDLPASGTVVALNEGIYSSKANYIAFLDPTDTARTDRIEIQFKYFEANRDVEVVSSRVKYVEESIDRNLKPYIEWSNKLLNHEEIYKKRFVNSSVLHSSLMFKKDLITSFGPFEDGEFPEDYELLLRWMNKGIKFIKLEDELTNWHDDIQRLSRRHMKYNSTAASKIKAKYFNYWYREYFRTPPDILLWRMKSSGRDKLSWLEKEGLNIVGYIDNADNVPWIDDKPVFNISEIPSRTFVIFLVEQFDPGNVPDLLSDKGLEEGTNFIMMG